MFEARLLQGVLLKKIIAACKDLVSEANFDCNSRGISMQAMDSSHVSLVTVLLRAEAFDPYRCDRNICMGINMGSLFKLLSCGGAEDSLTLKHDDANDDKVELEFVAPDGGRVSEYALKLMNIDADLLGIPDNIEYDAEITLPSGEFQNLCKNLTVMGDVVTITCTKEGVLFSSGGELGAASISYKAGHDLNKEDGVKLNVTNQISLSFALRYLNLFTKASVLAPTVSLSLNKETPMLVTYNIENVGYAKFFLAPKINENEQE